MDCRSVAKALLWFALLCGVAFGLTYAWLYLFGPKLPHLPSNYTASQFDAWSAEWDEKVAVLLAVGNALKAFMFMGLAAIGTSLLLFAKIRIFNK